MIIHSNISTLFIRHIIICTYNKITSHQLQVTGVVGETKHNVQVVIVFKADGYVMEIEIVLVLFIYKALLSSFKVHMIITPQIKLSTSLLGKV